jgi:hypothetical protein
LAQATAGFPPASRAEIQPEISRRHTGQKVLQTSIFLRAVGR